MLINSYAKINLYLDVLGKRADGYHNISTLFATVDLCDHIRFVLTKKPRIQFLSNIEELSSDSNLVYVIAKRIFEDFKITLGLTIYLEKHIPIAGGLGGGSSNAASTIICLNRLLFLGMTQSYMNNLAAEYGSDINFFLYGGCALGTSRGEIIEPVADVDLKDLVLVNPGIKVPSKEAYELLEFDDNAKTGIWYNKLELGIRKKYKEIDETLNELKSFGAAEAMMSGSGATCIGFFTDEAAQNQALNYFKQKNIWNKKVRIIGRNEYQQCIQN